MKKNLLKFITIEEHFKKESLMGFLNYETYIFKVVFYKFIS